MLVGDLTSGHPLWLRLKDMGVGIPEVARSFFPSTDSALEWAEDQLLDSARPPPPALAELPLAQTDLLRGLPSEIVDWLDHRVSRHRYVPGEVIVRAGAADRSLHVITSGIVSVVASDGTTPLARFAAGTSFGEIALLDGGPRSAMVVADQDTVCAVLSLEVFSQLRSEHPELAMRLLESLSLGLAQRLRASTDQIRALRTPCAARQGPAPDLAG